MVDAPDLKSVVREGVRVRVPPVAPSSTILETPPLERDAPQGDVAQLVRAHDS